MTAQAHMAKPVYKRDHGSSEATTCSSSLVRSKLAVDIEGGFHPSLKVRTCPLQVSCQAHAGQVYMRLYHGVQIASHAHVKR